MQNKHILRYCGILKDHSTISSSITKGIFMVKEHIFGKISNKKVGGWKMLKQEISSISGLA